MGERRLGRTQFIRQTRQDGGRDRQRRREADDDVDVIILTGTDPAFAAHQIQSLLKAFAFWPQITFGQPPLTPAQQQQVMHDCVDMFLAVRARKP